MIRHVLAVRLHDLEVVVVHPDAALEIALVLLNLLGRNVEDISPEFVFFLLADVEDRVFRNFVAGQHEGHPMMNVIEVLARHGNAL